MVEISIFYSQNKARDHKSWFEVMLQQFFLNLIIEISK